MNSAPPRISLFFASILTLRQQTTIRRNQLGAALLLVALGPLVYATSGSSDPAGNSQLEVTERALPVTVALLVREAGYQQRRSFTGTIRARREAVLSFQRTAELVEVSVDQGDCVSAGQLLAQIDKRNLLAQANQLAAETRAEQAKLDELTAGPRVETIDAQRATVQDLENQVARLSAQQARRAELRRQQAVSQEAWEQSAFDLASTQARLEAAQHQLAEFERGTRAEQLEAQRAVVDRLRAQQSEIQIQLDQSQLVAPFAGKIVRRAADEGTVVIPGTPILELVESEPWEAWIGVPSTWAARLGVGDLCEIVVDGESYPARIRSVLSQLDSHTRTRNVVLSLLDTTDGRVVPGQMATLTAFQSIQAAGYWVPLSALSRATHGLWKLTTAEPATTPEGKVYRAGQQLVEVLHTEGKRAYVRGTLSDQPLAVVEGTHRLAGGQRLQVELAATEEGTSGWHSN